MRKGDPVKDFQVSFIGIKFTRMNERPVLE
jgi:hypothetical protein